MNKISIIVSACHNYLKINMIRMILHFHFSFIHYHPINPSFGRDRGGFKDRLLPSD